MSTIAIRVILLASLTLMGCRPCKTSPPDVCGLSDHTGYFSQVGEELRAKLRAMEESYTTIPMPTEELKASSCCTRWSREVAGYCQAKVDEYCDKSCSSQEERADCKGPQREPVRVRCLAEVMPTWRHDVPTCAPMELASENGISTMWPRNGQLAVCPFTN